MGRSSIKVTFDLYGHLWKRQLSGSGAMTLLGSPLDALKLEDVENFLADADSEPLLWEAKGTEMDPHKVRKEICGFANGRETAYLILGAEKVGGKWQLKGVNFDDDPPAWVTTVVEGGLRPMPRVEVKSLPTSDGKHVAVVEIPPIAVPPCICRGTVYERVSGRTIPVKEPIRLAELYRRGETARRLAQDAAFKAASELLSDRALPGYGSLGARVAVAVSATAHPPHISSSLFSIQYEEEMARAAREILMPPRGGPFDPSMEMGFAQGNRSLSAQDPNEPTYPLHWHVRAIWDGTVAVCGTWVIDNIDAPQVTSTLIRPAWEAASSLVEKLCGTGPTYTKMQVEGDHPAFPLVDGLVFIERGPSDAAPSPADIDSVERELRRATGEKVYET